MKKQGKIRTGMTLVEILVAVSLFTAVGLLALTVFINITRIQGRLALENAIYEDARFMMERISRAVRNNAVDYEEYFNKSVNPGNEFGKLHGCYAAQFYNPGEGTHRLPTPSLTADPGSLGAICNNTNLYTGQECVVYKPSIDLNTGMYPHKGVVNDGSNAFCPKYLNGLGCTPDDNINVRDQLYLINKDGSTKTIFARKRVKSSPDEHSLAMVQKAGEDTNNDGLVEKWKGCSGNNLCCAGGYDCNAIAGGTLESTLNSLEIYEGFVPISPLRSNITRLEFQITPGEDPRKAFAEPLAVSQPAVRITIAVQPSTSQLSQFGNPTGADIPTIVLQTTVSSRIQSEVKSYLGPDTYTLIPDCKVRDNP